MGAKVVQLGVGPMANFVYLLVDVESRDAIAIDSGWETEPIMRAVSAEGAKVKFVVATHGHFDHTSTMGELAKKLNAPVVAHSSSPIEHDVSVDDGQELAIGKSKVSVLHTPGHTQDSICLYDGMDVFTGDALFVGTIGRFERRNAAQVYRSLYEKILKLPPSTRMYPGHDYGEVRSRRLGEEKAENVYLQASSLSLFLSSFA